MENHSAKLAQNPQLDGSSTKNGGTLLSEFIASKRRAGRLIESADASERQPQYGPPLPEWGEEAAR